MTPRHSTRLSSARDPIAFWLAVAATVLAAFASFKLVEAAFAPARWAAVALWTIAGIAYAALAVGLWRSARATLWLADGRIVRGASSDRRGVPAPRGAFGWAAPLTNAPRPEVRTILGRPYLIVMHPAQSAGLARLQATPRAERTLAHARATLGDGRGWFSRLLLWHRTPPGSVIAPLDSAAVDQVLAALCEGSRSDR